jgi:hypothetical protein
MKMDTVRLLHALPLLALLFSSLPFLSASCFNYGIPGPGATCNVGPDSDTYLETLFVVGESSPGECQASAAAFGGEYYEKGKVVFTGVDNQISTVSALNIISDITPALTGTYTFSYPVQHTLILAGPVTAHVTYSIPGFGEFASASSVWTEIHQPTIVYIVSTSTSTTPYQVFVGEYYSVTYLHKKELLI